MKTAQITKIGVEDYENGCRMLRLDPQQFQIVSADSEKCVLAALKQEVTNVLSSTLGKTPDRISFTYALLPNVDVQHTCLIDIYGPENSEQESRHSVVVGPTLICRVGKLTGTVGAWVAFQTEDALDAYFKMLVTNVTFRRAGGCIEGANIRVNGIRKPVRREAEGFLEHVEATLAYKHNTHNYIVYDDQEHLLPIGVAQLRKLLNVGADRIYIVSKALQRAAA